MPRQPQADGNPLLFDFGKRPCARVKEECLMWQLGSHGAEFWFQLLQQTSFKVGPNQGVFS